MTGADDAFGPTLDASGGAAGEELTELPARIGRYEIVAVIGRGGMGVVYRAHDGELHRDVAIKILRPSVATENGGVRMLDEAKAMAALRHPNVVQVYDVGSTDDGIFLVMPLVRGGSLQHWLSEPRPWRAVVARFVAAGRGLAAAHAAGLVHRDFKPSNVLVGEGDEVMVADFGIAERPESASESTVAGTPAYMAPEQASGDAIDARADQFSFCVSMKEGLRGDAPSWLPAVLARGSSPTANARWPSMTALLDHIERRLARRRRVALLTGVIGVVAVASGAGFMLSRPAAVDPCGPAIAPLSAVWNSEINARVVTSFSATASPMAPEAVERVVPALDRYASEWRAARLDTCVAARKPREEGSLVDRQISCLDRRLNELRARAETFVNADPRVVQSSFDLVAGMTSVASCSDAAVLSRSEPLPESADERHRIAELEKRIADIKVFSVRAPPPEYLERATALATDAMSQGYLSVRSRALAEKARATMMARQDPEPALRELADTAARAKDDEAAAWAWVQLVQILTQKGKLDDARKLEPVATAAMSRAGVSQRVKFAYEMTLGGRAGNAGELEAATEHFRSALAGAELPAERAGALRNLSYSLAVRGQHAEARKAIAEAVSIAESVFGTHHPRYADLLSYRATILGQAPEVGDLDRAKSDLEQALAIQTSVYGDNNMEVLQVLEALASIETERNDWDSAHRHARRALAIIDTIDYPLSRPQVLFTLASITENRTSFATARPEYERALASAEEIFGKDAVDYTNIEQALAIGLSEAGDCVSARPYANHMLSVHEANKSPSAAFALQVLGRCELEEGRRAKAFALMDEALDRCANGCAPREQAKLQHQVGEKLVETGYDRPRGRILVTTARDGFHTLGDAERVKALDTWLAAQSAP